MDSRLGIRLKELRKLHNYNQDYVAGYIGVIRQTYSHYETGSRIPNTEVLYKLSKLYEIPLDDLLSLTVDIEDSINDSNQTTSNNLSAILDYFESPQNKKKFQNHSKEEKELLYYFEKLSELDKKEIIEFTKIKARKKDSK